MLARKKILKYEAVAMEEAIRAVRGGHHSIKAAARIFNVPKTTLYYKIKGKYPEGRKMGPKTNLTTEEENILVQWMFGCANKGFPVTKEQLMDSVEMLIKQLKRKNTFSNNKPGEKWYQLFIKRHPEVAQRLTQNLNQARAAVSEKQIKQWFSEVDTLLTEDKHKHILKDPTRIFNSDETAIFLVPKGQKVLVRRGEKAVYSFTKNDEKECVTLLVTANAVGNLAPPMVMFKHDRLPAKIVNEMPDHWALGRSENGWMTGVTFFEYIANIFHPWLINNKIELPVIFFVDGHTSHLTYSLSDFCSQNGIILVALLPNSTHILQPLDVSIFRPLKHEWKKAIHLWKIKSAGKRLQREDFAPIMNGVLQKLSQENFVNGFRTCGIFPWDKNAINYTKYFKNSAGGSPNTKISKELIKFHLKFLEGEISNEKLKKFEVNDIETEDISLYELWRKLKTDVADTVLEDVEENLENNANKNEQMDSGNNELGNMEENEDMAEEAEENAKIDEGNKNIDMIILDENEDSEKSQNEKNPEKNRENEETSPKNSNISINNDGVPTPFKNALFWPGTPKKTNKKRVKVRIPSVVSSAKGKEYFLKKKEEQKQKEQKKEERKKAREEKKRLKEIREANKKQKVKPATQRLSESSSESSLDVPDESEGEGDDWDKDSCYEDENSSSTLNSSRNDNTNDIISGDYVIVIYEEKYYPGKVKTADYGENIFSISTMIQSGFNFKWPTPEDLHWYPSSDLIQKIKAPIPVNSRGSYRVPEMSNFFT